MFNLMLGEAGHLDPARTILGEDTTWTRFFDTADLPTYRIVTVEFISTFRYRAPLAGVVEEEDVELQSDIQFSICSHYFQMSIECFAVLLGIYHRLKTVTEDFTQSLTLGEDGVMRAWWPISLPCRFSSTKFVLPRLETFLLGTPTGASARPDLHRVGSPHHVRDPDPLEEQPHQSPPPHADEPLQHLPHVYCAVRLTEPLEALLHRVAQQTGQLELQDCWLDRPEDLIQWTIHVELECA
ncbi:hypothetical protein R6Q57_003661 [Mikania cordata]